ncbi:Uncharacterized membrane protein [Pseudovibrio denitrificans]|uniref:Uncharacterized membrane protein n=1 Tax=Pseudovibrio denitrificans TaxID=258256 RepID=A0A1I6Z613_9HYPH|nr:exopolysaccharide Pel transporter PelG [Pseudovibrio denitrificans]SFT58125.1 Uncharacterized membrane protein [Pseudovibrio denitrificans]
MAGIGFELQRLTHKGDMTSHMRAIFHASMVIAGPWLMFIFCILFISLLTEQKLGLPMLTGFRTKLIYILGISLLTSAPVLILAIRMASDAIYFGKFHLIPQLYLSTLYASTILTAIVAAPILFVLLNVPLIELLAIIISCIIANLLWIALGFSSSLQNYKSVSLSFATGLLLTISLVIYSTAHHPSELHLLLAFSLGFLLCFIWLSIQVFFTFPASSYIFKETWEYLTGALKRYWPLALAATFNISALWVDKIIIWQSHEGQLLPSGLRHAPAYDSSIFIAQLILIPPLALFLIEAETNFFRNFRSYIRTITGHGTLFDIRAKSQELKTEAIYTLGRLTLIQLGLCALLILFSPLVVEYLNFEYRQAAIIRIAAASVLFQFVFFAASTTLIFINRNMENMLLQLAFLLLNAVCTYATLYLPAEYLGFGYFVACLSASFLAVATLQNAFGRLDQHIFFQARLSLRPNSWYEALR